ncbi:MAG: EF-P lysine aminoacylase GenX [Deltaproteobacteria bacterium]|nr:EF-P lysine aminoacylase GenX [Deltaproteobacteria bacterium]
MAAYNNGLASKQQRLIQRARILSEIRAFFGQHQFLEVETPQRIPCNAPELYIDPIASDDHSLHTSPELCMKRLLAAGYPLIFQLCHCWRSAERGQKHLPEFTMLEWYRSNSDYNELMLDCERLIRHLVPTGILQYQEVKIDLTTPFERLTLEQAFMLHAPVTLQHAIDNDCFEEHYSQYVEPQLGTTKPTIIYDFPTSMAALACIKDDDPQHAERFELYIAGVEVANAFSELTDAEEQRRRFTVEEQQRRDLGKAPTALPEPFLNELSLMPPSAGIALGIDRLVMLLTDADRIDEVVAFCPEDL